MNMPNKHCHFIKAGWMLFIIGAVAASCGGSATQKNSVSAAVQASSSLADKIFAVAEALPLPEDSASAFINSLFTASDSLQVKKEGDNEYFISTTGTFSVRKDSGQVSGVVIERSEERALSLPLNTMSAKMDSAWRNAPDHGFKEPPHVITAYFTDTRQRRKIIAVSGVTTSSIEKTGETSARTVFVSVTGKTKFEY
jgi:hypothetical protein